MSNLYKGMAVVFMMFALFLFTSAALAADLGTPGTYIGVAQGNNGEVKVEVVVEADRIKSVRVLSHKETPGLSDAAINGIPETVVSKQTLAVDTVSGATYSSKAVLAGIKDALTQAGADIEALSVATAAVTAAKKPATVTSNATVLSADVVVVGGGGAGLVAALSAAERGADVILLEKMGHLGGATMLSAGIVPAAGTRFQAEASIEDSVDAFARDIFRPAHYSQRRDLVYTVAEGAKDVVDWMDSLGVNWKLITSYLYNGQTQYRMHQAEGQGIGIVKALTTGIENSPNIRVLLQTPGVGLLTGTDGRVTGVIAETKDKEKLSVVADSVILCTSGFAANKEMLRKYIPEIVGAYPMMAPGATGEGIEWGMQLGADVENMHAYQGYAPFSREKKHSLDMFVLYRGGIMVNSDGDRFTNEYLGYSELAAHVVNQPGHIAYMIFDSVNAENTAAFAQYQQEGIVRTGNTPAELAKQLNVDPKKLERVFAQYEEGIAKGEDVFNRTKLPKEWKAPFYAVEVTGDLRHTQGGLVTDVEGHVLRPDGTWIEGLYAAGGVTEGFSSAGGPGYMSGNGLLQAFVFGRLAGQQAAVGK